MDDPKINKKNAIDSTSNTISLLSLFSRIQHVENKQNKNVLINKAQPHSNFSANESKNLQMIVLLNIKYATTRSAGIIFEYPMECIKTRWQANPQFNSIREIIKFSYSNYGWRGFYHGFLPNAFKKIPTLMFRWPIILQLPTFYKELLNNLFTSPKKNDHNYAQIALANFMSAFTIASIETPLAAPFEACRLEFTVNPNNTKNVFDYFKFNSTIKSQFRGIGALYYKEIFGWSSFLISCNVLRQATKVYNADNTIKLYQLALISLAVGFANSAAIMPWDTTRSQIQKHKDIPDKTIPALKTIIKRHGYKGLYSGWQIRALQIGIATTISIPVMENFENELQQNTSFKR